MQFRELLSIFEWLDSLSFQPHRFEGGEESGQFRLWADQDGSGMRDVETQHGQQHRNGLKDVETGFGGYQGVRRRGPGGKLDQTEKYTDLRVCKALVTATEQELGASRVCIP